MFKSISPFLKIGQTICTMDIFFGFSSIIRLLFGSCPTTIFWFIISIIIDAINAMNFGRLQSHICDKVCKIMPPFANFYPPTSIAIIFIILGVVAPAAQKTPRIIFWYMTQSVSSSSITRLAVLINKASTTFLVSTQNTINSTNCFFPTITFTNKETFFSYFMRKFNYKKFIKFLSSYISWLRTVWHTNYISYVNYSYEW